MQHQRWLKIRKLGKDLFEVKAFSYWAFSCSINTCKCGCYRCEAAAARLQTHNGKMKALMNLSHGRRHARLIEQAIYDIYIYSYRSVADTDAHKHVYAHMCTHIHMIYTYIQIAGRKASWGCFVLRAKSLAHQIPARVLLDPPLHLQPQHLHHPCRLLKAKR